MKALTRFRSIVRFNDWPLAFKFLAAMILVASLPLALVGFLNARNTQIALEESIGNSFEQQAKDQSALIAAFVEEQVSILEALSSDDRIRNELEWRNERYTGTEEEILAELLELDQVWRNSNGEGTLVATTLSSQPLVNPVTPSLLKFKQLFNDHVEVFITDIRGATVGSTDLLSDYYQADEEWWQSAYKNGEGTVYVSDPEFDESANTTAILIAVPLFTEGDQGEILGIIRTTIDIQSFVDELADIRIGETGRAMLLNSQGEVIADPNGQTAATLPASTVNHILQHNASAIHTGELGNRVFFGHQRVRFPEASGDADASTLTPREQHITEALDNLGWRVVIRQDASEALAPVSTANRLAIITIVMAVVVAGVVAFALARLLTRQLDKLQELFQAVNVGNYQARAEVISGDELGQAAASLNTMLDNTLNLIQSQEERDALQASIIKLLEEVSDVAEGDLTVEAEVTTDATGAIADSFNFMILQLREIISNVQNSTLQVSSSATQIQSTTQQLSEGSETQATKITQTTDAIKEMTVSIQHVAENASRSATVANEALSNAKRGTEAVQNTIKGMERIRNQVQETSKRIKRLGESSQEIGEIVQLIGDIADRTSILALNASIQAAMAGEAGRGFAVVAEEVERLADQATDATKQIDALVRTIQTETNETVTAMEESTREVVEGSQIADQAGQALNEIEVVSNRLADLIRSISEAAKQQADGSEAVSSSMNEIAQVTQQTVVGTQQTAGSINELTAMIENLRASVSTFKIPSNNGHVT